MGLLGCSDFMRKPWARTNLLGNIFVASAAHLSLSSYEKLNQGKTMSTVLLVVIGLFSMVGALFDWDFFMNHRKARFIVAMLGREGARGFYLLLGAAIAAGGLSHMLGII